MLKPRLIFRNLVALGTGEFVDRVLAMFLTIYLARVLGAAAFGMIGIGISIIRFGRAFISSGSLNFGVRATARDPASVPGIYAAVTGFRLWAGLIVLAAGIVVTPWAGTLLGIESRLLLVYLLLLPMQAFTLFWLFRGLEKMHLVAGGHIAQQALMLGTTLLLVHSADDVLLVPVIEIAALGLIIAWSQYWARERYRSMHITYNPTELREVARESLGIGISNVFRMVHTQGDVLLLGILAATTAVAGEFLAAQKVVLTLSGFTFLLVSAALPSTARLIHDDRERAIGLQNRLIRINLLLFMPLVVLGTFYAEPVIALLYGDEYRHSVGILQLMLWTLVPAVFLAALRQTLMAAAAIRAVMFISLLAAVAHIVLAILLVPHYGAQGAALANLSAQVLATIILLWMVRGLLGGSVVSVRMLGPLLGAGAAYLVLQGTSNLMWPVQAGLGIAVYAGASLALGSVSSGELKSLLDIFARADDRGH